MLQFTIKFAPAVFLSLSEKCSHNYDAVKNYLSERHLSEQIVKMRLVKRNISGISGSTEVAYSLSFLILWALQHFTMTWGQTKQVGWFFSITELEQQKLFMIFSNSVKIHQCPYVFSVIANIIWRPNCLQRIYEDNHLNFSVSYHVLSGKCQKPWLS